MIDKLTLIPQNILIIDDVNANLVAITEIIRKAGLIARPVTSARQAVNAIEAMPPSLILMDVSMPDIDGFIFCSMLKKHAFTRDIPVIFISALNSIEDKIRGLKAGAVDYITKPYDPEELTLRIRSQLMLHKVKNDLEESNLKLYAIINNQINRLFDSQKNIVNALVKLLETKECFKTGHFECIAKNSKILAMSLQLSPLYKNLITTNFIETIELAAPLLDIGILMIEEIRKECCDKNLEDNDLWKSHTTVGATFLKEINSMDEQNEFISQAVNIARYHHENWDGSGFPEGLKGVEIPLCARIISIINAFHHQVNYADCEKTYLHQYAIDYINNRAGSCFDPDIVSIFNKIQFQLKY